MFKNFKMIMLISLSLILILNMGAISAFDNITENPSDFDALSSSQSANLEIPLDNDENSNLGNVINVEGNTFENIQQAIDEAQENDTIQLNGAYIGNNSQIVIEKSLTISASNGAVLDAGHTNCNILIKANSITLNNLKFINANNNQKSFLAIKQTNVNITDCDFYGNSLSKEMGGVINLYSGRLEIRNCNFKNNTASFGGAIYASFSSVSVWNSNFYDNAAHRTGSAVHIEQGSYNCFNCTFLHNLNTYDVSASNYFPYDEGSTAYINGWNSSLVNCIFSDNNGLGQTNGIYLMGGNHMIKNCSFTDNRLNMDNHTSSCIGSHYCCDNITIDSCDFKDNEAGAISIELTNSLIKNCSYENNHCYNRRISLELMKISGNNVTLLDNSFINNYYDSVTFNIDNSIICNILLQNNTLKDYYSTRNYITGTNLTLQKCQFKNNIACRESPIWAKIENSKIVDCIFSNNEFAGMFYDAIVKLEYGRNNLIYNCSFMNNKQSGISMTSDNKNTTIDRCSFINNTEKAGAGIKASGNDTKIMNSVFINNSAIFNMSEGYNDQHGIGGAIYIYKVMDLVISNNTFAKNTASKGGAIGFYDDIHNIFNSEYDIKEQYIYPNRFKIINCNFVDNKAFDMGGAFFCYSWDSSVKMKDDLDYTRIIESCSFYNNSAGTVGGAVYWTSLKGKLMNSIFDNNKHDLGIYKKDADQWDYIAEWNNKDYDLGSAIAGNILLKDIFLGQNANNIEEFEINKIVNCKNVHQVESNTYNFIKSSENQFQSYVNIKLESNNGNYTLKFVSNKNQPINLNDYTVCVKDKAGNFIGNVIISNGVGSFAYKEGMTLDDFRLYNTAGTLINKLSCSVSATQSGSFGNKKINVKVVDENSKPIANNNVVIKFSNGINASLVTDKNGIASYTCPFDVGTYKATILTCGANYYLATYKLNSIKIDKTKIKISCSKLTTTYNSGKTLNIKVTNTANKALSGVKLKLKTYNGKKYNTYSVKTESNGIAKFKASTLDVGKYDVEITSDKNVIYNKVKTSIKINTAKTTVKAPQVTNKARQNAYFKVTVKNKATNKAEPNIKIKLMLYKGKTYKKSFTRTTDYEGIAKLNTKTLDVGTYKVVISSANKNYIISATSKIIIKK